MQAFWICQEEKVFLSGWETAVSSSPASPSSVTSSAVSSDISPDPAAPEAGSAPVSLCTLSFSWGAAVPGLPPHPIRQKTSMRAVSICVVFLILIAPPLYQSGIGLLIFLLFVQLSGCMPGCESMLHLGRGSGNMWQRRSMSTKTKAHASCGSVVLQILLMVFSITQHTGRSTSLQM